MSIYPKNTKKTKASDEEMTKKIKEFLGYDVPKTKVAATPKPKATPKPTPKPKATLGPLPKNPTLNDYLARGLKPPVKGKKKLPSDADVKLKGYNS